MYWRTGEGDVGCQVKMDKVVDYGVEIFSACQSRFNML